VLLPLSNTPRDYAWGSKTAIAELLGYTPSGLPEAELWLGAHPGSPATVNAGEPQSLNDWISSNPSRALSGAKTLPFLLKVLAADSPLSLQAHPSREQARAGYARENELGIPLDSPIRNYKDSEHKPELIVALSDEFIALCGFRPIASCVHDLVELVELTDASTELAAFVDEFHDRANTGTGKTYAWAVEYLLRGGDAVAAIISQITSAALTEQALAVAPEATKTIRTLAAAYPSDPGIVIGAMLNRVVLDRGEGIYLPAGNVHAYIHGLGIELMSSSDNVLRGGLTTKHVDVDELLCIADFEPLTDARLTPTALSSALTRFEAPVDDFVLYRRQSLHSAEEPASTVDIGVAGIALCVDGQATLTGPFSSIELSRGDACFVTGDEKFLRIDGSCDIFVATSRG
jgi:mannose-6-phosphate isomerase